MIPNTLSALSSGVRFADAVEFLFHNAANQNLFLIFGTPDKVVAPRVGEVFGAQCIHTPQSNTCSRVYEELVWLALPLDES